MRRIGESPINSFIIRLCQGARARYSTRQHVLRWWFLIIFADRQATIPRRFLLRFWFVRSARIPWQPRARYIHGCYVLDSWNIGVSSSAGERTNISTRREVSLESLSSWWITKVRGADEKLRFNYVTEITVGHNRGYKLRERHYVRIYSMYSTIFYTPTYPGHGKRTGVKVCRISRLPPSVQHAFPFRELSMWSL